MKEIYKLQPTYPINQITAEFIMNTKPPTLYSIMNSIANYNATEKTKIRNLAKATHEKIFDFDYTLSSAINKSDFEEEILNHYIMRRIGFETFTAFQIYLENKLKEILPYYNILFDSLKDYNLFNNGEVITRETTTNRVIANEGETNTESRFSEYPQNRLHDINDGTYVSNQTKNSGTVTNNTNDDNVVNEEIKRSPTDKMSLYKTYLDTKRSIMSMIYNDLDILFYGIE